CKSIKSTNLLISSAFLSNLDSLSLISCVAFSKLLLLYDPFNSEFPLSTDFLYSSHVLFVYSSAFLSSYLLISFSKAFFTSFPSSILASTSACKLLYWLSPTSPHNCTLILLIYIDSKYSELLSNLFSKPLLSVTTLSNPLFACVIELIAYVTSSCV